MADKRLIYNENGTNAEIPNSGSNKAAYFDDTSNTLVAQGLIINRVTASIGSVNGILITDGNGRLASISTASATTGQYLQSDGTSWAFRNATGQATGDYISPSDLSGSLAAPTVLSIENVTSGTLSALNGGTGVSSFTSGGIFIKDSTSTIKMLRPDAGASVLRPDGSGSWYSGGSTGNSSYNVRATLYTCSNLYTSSTYQWTKPTGHSNVRVILMGGGGGGSGGRTNPSDPGWRGQGGGPGGLSMYDFTYSGILSASVVVGNGGIYGESFKSGGGAGNPGSPGGDTTFNVNTPLPGFASPTFFYAGGGTGGEAATGPASPTSAPDGFGNISRYSNNFGSGGGSAAARVAEVGNASLILGGITASAGENGGRSGQTALPGGDGRAAFISLGAAGVYAAVGGGGGIGGTPSTNGIPGGGNGGNGISGSGGGAGGQNYAGSPTTSRGGYGGDGYAIIISW